VNAWTLREMGSAREGGQGGPGPPSKEQDKQLICNSGGDETPMGEPGGQQDGFDMASRTHYTHTVFNIVNE
jgi:hypothetical protein